MRPACMVLAGSLFCAGAAQAAYTGVLDLATDPPGVTVYVDGKRVGSTPLLLPELSVGEHRLRLVKRGYEGGETTITIVRDEVCKISIELRELSPRGTVERKKVTLVRDTGKLMVLSVPSDQPVTIMGERKGRTALSLADMSVGTYPIQVGPVKGAFTIRKGKLTKLMVCVDRGTIVDLGQEAEERSRRELRSAAEREKAKAENNKLREEILKANAHSFRTDVANYRSYFSYKLGKLSNGTRERVSGKRIYEKELRLLDRKRDEYVLRIECLATGFFYSHKEGRQIESEADVEFAYVFYMNGERVGTVTRTAEYASHATLRGMFSSRKYDIDTKAARANAKFRETITAYPLEITVVNWQRAAYDQDDPLAAALLDIQLSTRAIPAALPPVE